MGRAILQAVDKDQESAARASDARAADAALDDADVREQEGARLYRDAAPPPQVKRASPLRRLIDRLSGR